MKYIYSLISKDLICHALICFIILGLIFGYRQFYNPILRESPSTKTIYILSIVARVINESKHTPPKNELLKWVCNNGLERFLPNPMWCPKKYFNVSNNAYDFFGNQLYINFIDDVSHQIPINKFKILKYNLIIWSSGPNGINEWGYGDDIVH